MIKRPLRLAAVDIGSLTVRLGIAEIRHPRQPPHLLHRREDITRLGAGVAATGRLRTQARADTLRALAGCAALCRHWQVRRVSAVATQAVRQAADREEFLQRVWEQTGLRVEVLPPPTEAQLCLRGILASLNPVTAGHRPLVVFDLGGGSLEWALFRDDTPPALFSLPCGALTLAQSWPASDPPRPDELLTLQEHIRLQLLPLQHHLAQLNLSPDIRLVGSGGAITTLAALHLHPEPYQPETVNNLPLSREVIEHLASRLQALPQASRGRLSGLSPAKADVIIPGAAVILAILRLVQAPEVMVMDAGLLEGVLARLAAEVLTA